jgi:hypothetical protein
MSVDENNKVLLFSGGKRCPEVEGGETTLLNISEINEVKNRTGC